MSRLSSLNFDILKKIKIALILVAFFTTLDKGFSQGCGNCYSEFNATFAVATTMYYTCITNYLTAPVNSYTTAMAGNTISASSGAFSNVIGFIRCQNTYYSIWDDLGKAFDVCIVNCGIP